ncbi:MAG: DUF393 domain-containing protein [Sphingobacteriales bacterium]|nr:MAG: DUF393 domain-containing protein [Sphingobacteriales bacterium]
MNYKELQQPVLFFDGICNLCAGAVQLIMRHDKKKQFMFASLQSTQGAQAMADTGLNTEQPGSIILYYRGQYYMRSAAVLKITSLLGGLWSMTGVFKLFPALLRDGLYKWIARNRYRWFGKRSECLLPTPENKARFLP